MDKIFKAVTEDVKEKSLIQQELFYTFYKRKKARYEEGYKSLVMDKWMTSDITFREVLAF